MVENRIVFYFIVLLNNTHSFYEMRVKNLSILTPIILASFGIYPDLISLSPFFQFAHVFLSTFKKSAISYWDNFPVLIPNFLTFSSIEISFLVWI
jgi:hypothetical protein